MNFENNSKLHMANLLLAVMRCVYFLESAQAAVCWPLEEEFLSANRKSTEIFNNLAALNERFGKLQDTLGSALKHLFLLSGENGQTFLQVLLYFEKLGIVESHETWIKVRLARNAAAHEYDTEYSAIAQHFNRIHLFTPYLYRIAKRLLHYCQNVFAITPVSDELNNEFAAIISRVE